MNDIRAFGDGLFLIHLSRNTADMPRTLALLSAEQSILLNKHILKRHGMSDGFPLLLENTLNMCSLCSLAIRTHITSFQPYYLWLQCEINFQNMILN